MLFVAELITRAVTSSRLIYDVEMHRYAKTLKERSETPGLSHQHIPNTSSRLMGVDIAINNIGFRDENFNLTESEKKNEFRILVVGSSITMGWGVERSKVFTELVEERLEKKNYSQADRKVSIINSGIGNYNAEMQAILLIEDIKIIKPHLVVLHYFINDAEINTNKTQPWIIQESYLTGLLYVRYKQILATASKKSSTLGEYYSNLYSDDSESWMKVKAAISQMKEVSEFNNADFLVLIQPELNDFSENSLQENAYDRVRMFLKDNNVKYYDIVKDFRKKANNIKSYWISYDDSHPNASGHEIMATSLHSAITGSRKNTIKHSDTKNL